MEANNLQTTNMTAQSNSSLDDFPWPSPHDRLFEADKPPPGCKPSGSPAFYTLLESIGPTLQSVYREAYWDAGQALAMCVGNRRMPGILYPMLFCFRHYVELSLKTLVQVYAELEHEETPVEAFTQHNLVRLWSVAKRLLDKASGSSAHDDGTLTDVERCIREFDNADRNAQLFRYATDRMGRSVEAQLPQISVEQFLMTMNNLHSFFEGCKAQAEVWKEWREEMRAYYADDIAWNGP